VHDTLTVPTTYVFGASPRLGMVKVIGITMNDCPGVHVVETVDRVKLVPSVLNMMLHVIGSGLPGAVGVLKVIEATTLVPGATTLGLVTTLSR